MNDEVRVELKSWLESQKAADTIAEQDGTSDEVRLKHQAAADEKLDSLIVTLGKEPEPVVHDSEAEEVLSLYEQADPTRYVHLAINDQPLDGAEAELNSALGMPGMRSMPIGLLLREDERKEEQLADQVTAITTETTVNTSPIAARVFKQTAAGLMGFQMPTVGSGVRRYPFLTSGTQAAMVSRGQSVEARAADISVVEITPTALQATFILDKDTILQNGAEVRTMLESDTRQVLADALDDEILRGSGTNPTRGKGIFNFVTGSTVAGGDIDTATTWAAAETIKAQFVDSRYFMEDTPTRMLIGLETYRYLRGLYPDRSSSRDDPLRTALDAIRGDGVQVIVRDRNPAPVAATGSNGQYQDALYASSAGASNVVIPVWQDMEILVDPYSSGRLRQVQVTFNMYFGIGYRNTSTAAVPGLKKISWVLSDAS